MIVTKKWSQSFVNLVADLSSNLPRMGAGWFDPYQRNRNFCLFRSFITFHESSITKFTHMLSLTFVPVNHVPAAFSTFRAACRTTLYFLCTTSSITPTFVNHSEGETGELSGRNMNPLYGTNIARAGTTGFNWSSGDTIWTCNSRCPNSNRSRTKLRCTMYAYKEVAQPSTITGRYSSGISDPSKNPVPHKIVAKC